MIQRIWLIYHPNKDLFWKVDLGWVGPCAATHYTNEEKDSLGWQPFGDDETIWVHKDSKTAKNWVDKSE